MGMQSVSAPEGKVLGMSILVGGNSDDELVQLAKALGALGHHSTLACGTDAIIKQLCEQNYDVILLDLSSAGIDANSVFTFINCHDIHGAVLVLDHDRLVLDHDRLALDDTSLQTETSPVVQFDALSYIEVLYHPLTERSLKSGIRRAITQYTLSRTSGSIQAELQDSLDNRLKIEQAHYAQYDSLTGLPSRILFTDRLNMLLAQSKRSQSGFAVMHLNLDRFKRINDSLGLSVGDRLLKALSQRVSERLRGEDTLARLGSDEFLLLLPNVEHQASAATIAEKIMKIFQSPFMLNQQEIHVTARLGIALYPQMSSDPANLMNYADLAMAQLKNKRQTGYTFYCDSMNLSVPKRFNIEHDLRQALLNDECFVQYQPQISMEDGSLLGVEALIRWHHPKKGLIAPDEFIPVAEESQQIIEVDTWMLNQACRQIKQQFDNTAPPFKLAVNFSTLFVEQPNFVDILLTTLAKYDFPNHCFELEITENKELNDMELSVEKLKRLRRAGMGIAIDDFGVGNAMFKYLKHIPATTLKIDRSFINDIKDSESGDSIVDAIVAMGHSRDLHIVAEGVETDAQIEYLKKINCHTVQGYLTGKAMPLQDIINRYCEPNSLKNTA